ncbi:MAG TPA: hypothetical protein VHE30_08055 [Polyangiaceae bacterium]|nr:hypothetical protein [Polyangiaceae bacterium]
MTRAWVAALLLVGCGDPVHDDAVSALGPEVNGVGPGPMHRPGQPCLVCHGGQGPGHPDFALGGTVFDGVSSSTPVPNARVRVVGADSRVLELVTNCAGNFWIDASDFGLAFPAGAAVTTDHSARVMLTAMHRSGSCGDCHRGEASSASPGRLWVAPDRNGGSCTTDWAGATLATVPACDGSRPSCGATPSYQAEVASILAARCTACHSPDGEAKSKDFTTRNGILAEARTAQTNVLKCQMPPPPLAPVVGAEREALLCWLADGAPDN